MTATAGMASEAGRRAPLTRRAAALAVDAVVVLAVLEALRQVLLEHVALHALNLALAGTGLAGLAWLVWLRSVLVPSPGHALFAVERGGPDGAGAPRRLALRYAAAAALVSVVLTWLGLA